MEQDIKLTKIEIVASYHPSPRNVNTKRLDENKMVKLLKELKINHIFKLSLKT